MATTVRSRKSRGMNFQRYIKEKLIEELGIHPEDIRSNPAGNPGEDIIMARAAREKFPFSIEAKNVERLNLWEAWKQCCANAANYDPLLVVKRNRQKPLAVLDLETFIRLVGEKK